MLMDVVLCETEPVASPLGLVIHHIDTGRFELLINFCRGREANFRSKAVLYCTKDDEIMG